MTLAVLFAAAAITAGWVWPRWMLRRRGSTDPRTTVAAWLLMQAVTLAAALLAAGLLIVPGHAGHLVSALVGQCVNTIRHPSSSAQETTAGMGGILAGSVLLAAVVAAALDRRGRVGRRSRRLLETVELAGELWPSHPGVWWLHDPRPAAFCLPRGRVRVAASTGLFDVLTDSEVNAVLAHEHAHRRLRHHAVIAWAEAAGSVLRFIPVFAVGARVMRGLCEQAADAAAADDHHAPVVASALRKLAVFGSPATAPVGALNAAQGAIRERLRVLETHSGRRRVRSAAALMVMTLAVTVTPPVLTATVVALVTCS
ncbi:MAG: M56 family metallopeptidase [Gordonia polyisoprenivorans]|nr:M56 family metallopeptidase [Gordonia polyisoprenivorans]